MISASEWNKLAEGIVQRVRALRPDQRNDMQIGNRHVRVAVGRDYADVAPLKGIYSGCTAAALDRHGQHDPAGVGGRAVSRPPPRTATALGSA